MTFFAIHFPKDNFSALGFSRFISLRLCSIKLYGFGSPLETCLHSFLINAHRYLQDLYPAQSTLAFYKYCWMNTCIFNMYLDNIYLKPRCFLTSVNMRSKTYLLVLIYICLITCEAQHLFINAWLICVFIFPLVNWLLIFFWFFWCYWCVGFPLLICKNNLETSE